MRTTTSKLRRAALESAAETLTPVFVLMADGREYIIKHAERSDWRGAFIVVDPADCAWWDDYQCDSVADIRAWIRGCEEIKAKEAIERAALASCDPGELERLCAELTGDRCWSGCMLKAKLLKNGATVLERKPGVVLAVWNKGTRREFITWAISDDGDTFWGHYFDKLAPAVEDFEKRS